MNLEKHNQTLELFRIIVTEIDKTLSDNEQAMLVSIVASRNPRLWLRSKTDTRELLVQIKDAGLLDTLGELYRIFTLHAHFSELSITGLIEQIAKSVSGDFFDTTELSIKYNTASEILVDDIWIVVLYIYRMVTFDKK